MTVAMPELGMARSGPILFAGRGERRRGRLQETAGARRRAGRRCVGRLHALQRKRVRCWRRAWPSSFVAAPQRVSGAQGRRHLFQFPAPPARPGRRRSSPCSIALRHPGSAERIGVMPSTCPRASTPCAAPFLEAPRAVRRGLQCRRPHSLPTTTYAAERHLAEIEAQWGAAPGGHRATDRRSWCSARGSATSSVGSASPPSAYEGDPMRLLSSAASRDARLSRPYLPLAARKTSAATRGAAFRHDGTRWSFMPWQARPACRGYCWARRA